MDGWQAVQSWAMFTAVAAGLGYYYYWPHTAATKQQQKEVKEAKKDPRRPVRRQDDATSVTTNSEPSNVREQDIASTRKRKAAAPQPRQPTAAHAQADEDEGEEIDMSIRQFAASMQQAREGIQVRSSDTRETRTKTVKPKLSSAVTPVVSSDPSMLDIDEHQFPITSPATEAGNVQDMLEQVSTGPSSLRITAAQGPVREKPTRQPNKETVETKKQRQNRRKAEERRLALAEEEQIRRARGEQQRRTAREARGEPAKNGIAIAPAPANNPWGERDGSRHEADTTGNAAPLLDTLDTDSTSSSTQEASTAATSVVADAASSRFAAEDDYAKAVEESERETGWNEVKSSKKGKRVESNGTATPVAALATSTTAPRTKVGAFQALLDDDDGEQSG